jgi:CO/xanthine dehydrogenase Mo-binding subunit
MGDNLSMIGKSIPRVDALEKVTGQAKFVADFKIPNAGMAKLLRSPHPHAKILAIDTSRAERMLGVRAVVTGEDPLNRRQGMLYADQYIIARGVVRHDGEAVACVVADTEEIAEEAVKSIEVRYEELPAVFDVEEAMDPGCPVVIHPEALEEQMDIVAHRLGIDPVEFRKRHLLKEGERNCMGEVTHSVGAEVCLEKTAEALEWGKEPDIEERGWRRGKGIALGCQSTPTQPPSFVHVKVHSDGIIELHHCAIEQGQGADTVMAQVAAEAFGVSVEEIKIGPKDTASAPFGPRTGGSRSTFYVGNATWRACQDAKRQIFELAAPRLDTPAEFLEIRGGKVQQRDTPERSLHIRELFAPAGFVPGVGEIIGRGACSVRGVQGDPETGQSERSVAFHSPGAYGVQIAVDPETGEIKIEKVVGCFDMGRPINPKMCEQQIEGSIGMGIGISLYEELVAEKGSILNPSFLDYKIPTTLEMPTLDNIKPLLDGSPHREGLFGAKGFGEATLNPFYAAVGNAFYHATGVRIRGLPLAKEKVLKAISLGKEENGDAGR